MNTSFFSFKVNFLFFQEKIDLNEIPYLRKSFLGEEANCSEKKDFADRVHLF